MVRGRVALMAIGAVVLLAANASAKSHVYVSIGVGIPAPAPVIVAAPPPPPPAPVIVAPPPAPVVVGYVWQPGYYVWTGYGYQVVPGAWVRPPYAHAVWVAPHWEAYHGNGYGHAHGSVWVNGYWRHR
jgi:hypothetical protein